MGATNLKRSSLHGLEARAGVSDGLVMQPMACTDARSYSLLDLRWRSPRACRNTILRTFGADCVGSKAWGDGLRLFKD